MKDNWTILVVDDEPRNLMLLETILIAQGYSLRKASSGLEAIQKVREEVPDLIILDVMMPGLDGFQVCRKLRKERPFRLVPIVMVTALNSLEDKVKGLENGADDFLSKPIRKEELIAKVRSLLRVRSLQLELEKSRDEVAEKNRQLEALGRFKDQLTHMLVHDLRNPLAGITGNLELLQIHLENGGDPEKLGILMQRTQESALHLTQMVKDILDISRLQENRLALQIQPVDLGPVFQECTAEGKAVANRKRIRLRSEVGRGLPQVDADPGILRRILGNLLQNALKFTPEGGEIRLEACLQDGEVRIRVSDTGEGIPEEYRETIFQRFARVPTAQGGPREGFGLGLSFCRLATEAHGGRIWVESSDSGGSLFILSLPRSRQKNGASEAAACG